MRRTGADVIKIYVKKDQIRVVLPGELIDDELPVLRTIDLNRERQLFIKGLDDQGKDSLRHLLSEAVNEDVSQGQESVCSEVPYGTIRVVGHVGENGEITSRETVYFAGCIPMNGEDTETVTLTYGQAFKALAEKHFPQLVCLLENADIVKAKVKEDKKAAEAE